MDGQVTIEGIDTLLIPFLSAQDESVSEALLARLIHEHAEPIINKIIRKKLRVTLRAAEGSRQNQDALEIASELRLIVFSELRALKTQPATRSINSFPSFVAIKTYSACADYFREKNPQRWRLKNLLRHHLKQNPQFALWMGTNRRLIAGLYSWRTPASPAGMQSDLPPRSFNVTAEQVCASRPDLDALRLSPDALLLAIFELSGQAIEFDRVVAIAAEVWGIRDRPTESFWNEDGEITRELVDASPGVELILEHRSYLARLWAEVCQLPALQRAALLLNLRDAEGGGVIAFIPQLGIASKTEIARMIGIDEKQFLALWNELPLDDASIAGILGLTRQQVINLRKTARERLARRMKGLKK
jgi:hypothetical protein